MSESDPHGIPQHAPGAKLDAGKLKTSFAISQFFKALGEVNRVSSYGAGKYTRNGWREVQEGESRYMEALLRHLAAHCNGEYLDEESGLTHVAHMAWNALAVVEFVCNTSQSTPKQQEQTSVVVLDHSSSQPVPKTEQQEDGDLKSIQEPEKFTSRITIGRKSSNTPKDSFQYSTTPNSTSEHYHQLELI